MMLSPDNSAVKVAPATAGTGRPSLNLNPETLYRKFDFEPFGFTHNLNDLDLFRMDSLLRLSEKFEGFPRDYFVAGGAPAPGSQFYSVPNGGLKPVEAIDRLDTVRCRVLLKRPENHDRGFRELLDTLFRQVMELRGGLHGETIIRLESAIFISSGSTTTPIHFDPEVGFFSQVEGEKLYHVYPPRCSSEEELERFYIRGRIDIGQLDINRLDPKHEHVFCLSPGKGFHQPQNSPHWVQTGNSRSISYTFIFQTDASRRRCRTRAFNYCLRRAGLEPAPVGANPRVDTIKAGVMRAAAPIQLAGRVWNKTRRVVFGKRL